MSARETVRRTMIWLIVLLIFPLGVLELAVANDGWPLLAWGGFPIAGAVILTARPGHAIGRLLIFIGGYWAVAAAIGFPAVGAVVPAWAESVVLAVEPLAWAALPIIVVLFPDSRLESAIGRVVAIVTAVIVGATVAAAVFSSAPLSLTHRPNPFAVPAWAPVVDFFDGGKTFLIVPMLLAGALVDLVLRWRRADTVRRLQFRWLAYGAGVTVFVLVAGSIFSGLTTPIEFLVSLCFNAIPVTLMIAVTRHGLFEINRVISRTVAYSIVTAAAVGVYAAVVSSVTFVLPNAPSFAVAAATLAAAALFLPVLRAVQRRLDRRFDRERYDARKVVDEFGERLRGDADPTGVTPDLIRAVDKALQPTTVGVWTGIPQRTDRDSARATRS